MSWDPCKKLFRIFGLGGNQFQGLPPSVYSFNRQPPIEGSQSASFMSGQPQEIGIGDLAGGKNHLGLEQVPDAEILTPELVFPGLAEPLQYSQYRPDITRSVGVLRMAGNPDDPVFGQWAGRPGFPSPVKRPFFPRIFSKRNWNKGDLNKTRRTWRLNWTSGESMEG